MPRQFPDLKQDVPQITAAELKQRLEDGEELTLLDTRREHDFESWHITHENLDVVNIPFMQFMDADLEEPADSVPPGIPDGTLVACCAKGISSQFVAEFLAREGYDVIALEDGMEGWAALNEQRPLGLHDDIDVIQFHRPSSGCLAYLFVAGSEAAVIDPLRAFASEYIETAKAQDATLRYAIDTHVHADHVSGIRAVAEESDATAVLPVGATDRGLSFDATLIEAGEELSLGDRAIQASALPGHTTEMMGYRLGDVFATGDTLFLDGVARPDLEDEAAAREAAGTLWETLQKLAERDDAVRIAPGHVGPTTAPGADGTFTASLGDLVAVLRAFDESQSDFVERVISDLPPRPPNFEEIIAINLGRESADREEAFELELGPNNCAVAE